MVRYLWVSNGNMQEGLRRCDVNVSVRPLGQVEFGTKVEIKNMNSFSAMSRAIDYEISRQILLHNQGQSDQIVQETRLWEEGAQKTVAMRKKEGLADYRYFPEPDLPEVVLTEEYVDNLRQSLPELPETKRRRYENMGLSSVNVATFFDSVVDEGGDVKLAANWIMGDIAAYLKTERLAINEIMLTPKELAELIASIQNGTISGKIGKEILVELIPKGGTVKSIIEEKDFVQARVTNKLSIIEERDFVQARVTNKLSIIEERDFVQIADPAAIAALRDSHRNEPQTTSTITWRQTKIMKESKGKANPMLLNKILVEKLKKDSG